MVLVKPVVEAETSMEEARETIKNSPWRNRVLMREEKILRLKKLRIAVCYMLEHNALIEGDNNSNQVRLAQYFGLTRQRVSQLVKTERKRLKENSQLQLETPKA